MGIYHTYKGAFRSRGDIRGFTHQNPKHPIPFWHSSPWRRNSHRAFDTRERFREGWGKVVYYFYVQYCTKEQKAYLTEILWMSDLCVWAFSEIGIVRPLYNTHLLDDSFWSATSDTKEKDSISNWTERAEQSGRERPRIVFSILISFFAITLGLFLPAVEFRVHHGDSKQEE